MYYRPHSKRTITNQSYDNYWKLTVEYTDIHGTPFRDTLSIIVKFIDKYKEELQKKPIIKTYYKELQEIVYSVFPKSDMGSTRKSINQFVKIGFIQPFLIDYHHLTKKFLNAQTNEEREVIFSQIYYNNATFNSSVTNDNSNVKPINFLLKTLMYHPSKTLSNSDIIALMVTDISTISKGYLTENELKSKFQLASFQEFSSKKYNQIRYFYRFLSYVPGISVIDKNIYYTEDATDILAGNIDTKRDPLMFRIMKENLKMESTKLYGKEVCYFSKMQTKGLVASHIWRSEDALKEMDVEAAYDYRNSLLLERNVDEYFDKYDLTFLRDGSPLYGSQITEDFINRYDSCELDNAVLVDERIEYLTIHNEQFESKQSHD